MTSYWRDCIHCGQRIIMAENNYGVWQPLEPDGSGRHVCFSGVEAPANDSSSYSERDWDINNLDSPLTYPTTCWWCGTDVFFHTNGNGDAVLFDSLGWPWQIHSCWEDNREDRSSAISNIESSLEDDSYDGIYYESKGSEVASSFRKKLFQVNGFIADNYALYENPDALNLSCHGQEKNLWTKLVV